MACWLKMNMKQPTKSCTYDDLWLFLLAEIAAHQETAMIMIRPDPAFAPPCIGRFTFGDERRLRFRSIWNADVELMLSKWHVDMGVKMVDPLKKWMA